MLDIKIIFSVSNVIISFSHYWSFFLLFYESKMGCFSFINSVSNLLSLDKTVIMTNSNRFRFPKTVLFGITAAYFVLIVATYFLYFKEPVEVCAKRMMIAQIIALAFQIGLNYINYRSKNKIVILATLFISSMLLFGAISAFFNLGLMCEIYGF